MFVRDRDQEDTLRLWTALYAFQAQTSRILLMTPQSFLLIDGAICMMYLVKTLRICVRIGVPFPHNFSRSQQANPVLLSLSPTLNEPRQKPSFNPISPHLHKIYGYSRTSPHHFRWPVYQRLPHNPRRLHLVVLQMDLSSTFQPTTRPQARSLHRKPSADIVQ